MLVAGISGSESVAQNIFEALRVKAYYLIIFPP
jgi:hypothetical protein